MTPLKIQGMHSTAALTSSESDDSDFDIEAHRAALEEQKRKLAKEREHIQTQMNSLKLGT